MNRALLTGLLASCFLAACATGVTPRKPDFDWPESYDALAKSELPVAELDQWWLLYDDPQLTALVERAQLQGLSVRDARARLDEAEALRAGALTQYNPQGGIQSNAEIRQNENLKSDDDSLLQGPRTRTANLSLPVSWELDLFGRRGNARDAADADLAAARFEYEATYASLLADVARTLFQARGLAVQLKEAQAVERISRDLHELLNRRVERGLTAEFQANRVAADVAQAQAQGLALAAELNATRRALLLLLGNGLDPLVTLAVEAELGKAPAIPITLPGDLLQRRPDIRRADARVRAAAGRVELAELEFFPRLTLQPNAGVNLQRGLVDSSIAFWSLGLGLTVPILDRPRLESALQAESARGQQAVIAYERSVQTAYSETDQALTRLAADRERVQILIDGDAQARKSYEAALQRFELGISDLQTLLDAERSWRSTRSALTTARVDALLRSVQVFQSLGGGWPYESFAEVAHHGN